MKHYGNVTKINGAEVDPVDIITFGAPCQDLSVAGKRMGLKHSAMGDEETTRSGLFFEAVRIIKEMREATNNEYPKYAVYENVPGAFSSNKGRDFHAVLEALCSVCDDTVSIPEPYDTKRTKLEWNKAGEIVGDNYSVAWRTLDAQYWGVPQRRKRIYLVADFTGRRAGEILFKPDGLRGDMSQGNEAGQGAAADAVGSVDGSVGVFNESGIGYWMPGYGCLRAEGENRPSRPSHVIVGVECIGYDMYNQASTGDKTRTLKTPVGGDDLPVVCLQGNGIDRADTAGCNGAGWRENESYTLNTVDRHAVCFENHQHGGYREGCGTLRASGGDYGGGSENVVCYDARGNGDGETACTITGDHQNRITDYTAVAVYEPKSALEENWGEAEAKNALRAGASKSSHAVVQSAKPPRKYIIRRLLPVECARLQGFPDWWSKLPTIKDMDDKDYEFWCEVLLTKAKMEQTARWDESKECYVVWQLVKPDKAKDECFEPYWRDTGNPYKDKTNKQMVRWYNKLHTDSAEYKAYGNGLALPCAEFVIHGIAEQGAKTLGSLFDGIGGFPLAGVLNGIKPVWASEVEPYTIAVTKSRFKEVHNGK